MQLLAYFAQECDLCTSTCHTRATGCSANVGDIQYIGRRTMSHAVGKIQRNMLMQQLKKMHHTSTAAMLTLSLMHDLHTTSTFTLTQSRRLLC